VSAAKVEGGWSVDMGGGDTGLGVIVWHAISINFNVFHETIT
jgi:hypothetical protein